MGYHIGSEHATGSSCTTSHYEHTWTFLHYPRSLTATSARYVIPAGRGGPFGALHFRYRISTPSRTQVVFEAEITVWTCTILPWLLSWVVPQNLSFVASRWPWSCRVSTLGSTWFVQVIKVSTVCFSDFKFEGAGLCRTVRGYCTPCFCSSQAGSKSGKGHSHRLYDLTTVFILGQTEIFLLLGPHPHLFLGSASTCCYRTTSMQLVDGVKSAKLPTSWIIQRLKI